MGEKSDWDLLSESYTRIFLPRFLPLYESMVQEIPSTTKSLLGYGEGPGEPSLLGFESSLGRRWITRYAECSF